MRGDRTLRGEKALRVPGGFEPLHASFPLGRRLVGVFGAVVKIAMLALLHARQNLPLGCTIVFEFICDDHPPGSQRLQTIPGIGPISATAILAAISDATQFKNGRQFAAWLGLVPREHSTGGKPRLLRISKRGDSYLRKLFVHGARATLRWVDSKHDERSRWLKALIARRGKNRAAVALANKNARIAWALLAHNQEYRVRTVV